MSCAINIVIHFTDLNKIANQHRNYNYLHILLGQSIVIHLIDDQILKGLEIV